MDQYDRVLTALRRGLTVGAAVMAGAASGRAQIGDVPEEGRQVDLPAARAMAPEPPLSPREELRTLRLPPGFKAELVAAEPMIHDPVAAAFDLDGALWVVEFNNYNAGIAEDLPALAAGGHSSAMALGRIIKLESSRHDGRYDRRTVWLDGLQRARGIAIVRDGVLISDTPNLWLARDPGHTGRCTEKTLLAGNYEAWTDSEESGSLMWGRDNVIRDIDFSYDYRYRRGAVQPLAVPVRGQFGISQDDAGRLFFNRNSDQLRCDFFAPTYGLRNPDALDSPWANVRIAQSQEVWPSHRTPAVNRGYRNGILGKQTGGLREDGTLLEYTAACSPLIYRGANFPAPYYGNAFVPDAAANLVKRNLLHESRGRITAVNAEAGREFLTSTDSRFRPVALLNAPDGSMLVVDMYRGIIQEYHYITSYLSHQSLGRHLEAPLFGNGRIFKITSTGGPLETAQPDLGHRSAAQLAALLGSPNGWWRDTAQQELVERGDLSAVPALSELALRAPSEATRLAALWTLDGLEATTLDLLREALRDSSTHVRAAAVRLHERWLGGGASGESARALGQLRGMARDPAPEVCVQLALTLGESPAPQALEVMQEVLQANGEDPFVAPALATGLKGRELEFLVERVVPRLLSDADRGPAPSALRPAAVAWAEAGPRSSNLLRILASAIVHRGDQVQIRALIALIGDHGSLPEWARLDVLQGFENLLRPAFRRSVGLSRLMPASELAPLAESSHAQVRRQAARLVAGLTREETAARERAAQARPLTGPETKLYEEGRQTFLVCAGCHQPNGGGMPNVAPSLVDSRWVSGYPEVLVHIVLNGKEGTPGFPGAMPPIGGTFDDEKIAGVLTYIRNSWGLQAGAVSPAVVAAVRAEIGSRQAAWTDAELARVEADTRRQSERRRAPPARWPDAH